MKIPTLDDVDVEGKSVLLRLDINSPIVNSKIADTKKFEAHVTTLKELESSRVVIMAHQSRPGKKDFTTLEEHAKVLSEILDRDVKYVDEIFSNRVIEEIKSLRVGEYLLLENVRFYSEETLKRSAEEHSRFHMVQRLKDHFDLFVNDAFASFHRPHTSVIGFVPVLPSVVGRLVEREVNALSRVFESEGSKVFILGGAKVDDSIRVLKNVLKGIADRVILTGVVANYVLMLLGYDIGDVNKRIVEEGKSDVRDEEVIEILRKYRGKIVVPKDVAVDKDGARLDVPIDEFDGRYRIGDIGSETISMISDEIQRHEVAVVNGPAGVFEDEKFAFGTFEVLKAVSKVKYSVVGGGHIATATRKFGLEDRMNHVSTAGGACIRFLSGEKLVALEVIKDYWEKKWSRFFGRA
ncbi:MAG: phosphoglycerate kinase [Archaeoglobales archaeon]|nr:MAG: phosphoglycerate kinase [Archaeoglobales archaeon]